MLAALHPRYLRLLVDWAALQPSPSRPAALNAPVDGCARGVPPCGSYPGVEGELAAIASARRAARSSGAPPPEVVVDILGAPAWAALPPHGCEAAGTASAARALLPGALGAYRALIAGLLSLAGREGVPLAWLAPWNEPNDPRFLSPQRASCEAAGAPLAAGAYAELARAASAQLRASGSGAQLLLGELGGYDKGSPHRLGIGQFVDGLPEDVLCLSHDWSVHAYAAYGRAPAAGADPVGELEHALDARGGCAAGARIWVTEAGAGAPRPGRPRRGAPGEEAAGCGALAGQLQAWSRDPRVAAVMQYSFREDPAYPVGLLDAGLGHVYMTYRLWSAWASGSPEPARACLPAP
ncbi:MAG TPA: hypothetical protein VNV44_00730 [Solirubrobacteraceae bacterium]|jgi:hypothetical protein|nr:hypothetical protein [Solirubrobacteraceae bacterium]